MSWDQFSWLHFIPNVTMNIIFPYTSFSLLKCNHFITVMWMLWIKDISLLKKKMCNWLLNIRINYSNHIKRKTSRHNSHIYINSVGYTVGLCGSVYIKVFRNVDLGDQVHIWKVLKWLSQRHSTFFSTIIMPTSDDKYIFV